MKQIVLSLLFPILTVTICHGSDSLTSYPAVVLVELRSEQNRMDAMKKRKDYAALNELTEDAKQVREKMIADFSDNYHQCPVYYFTDTNADRIKNRQFAGVLFNADGSIVKKQVIKPGDDNYVIVYYGYFLTQGLNKDKVSDSTMYYDPDNPSGKGLVVLNDKFEQIDRFYKYGYDELTLNLKRKEIKQHVKKYIYNSKRFDIEYYPFANLFQQNFHEHYVRHRFSPVINDTK